MPRYTRNAAILAKIETTVGTDAVPTGGANALLVSNLSPNVLNANNVSRDLIRSYFGGSEQLVGTANADISFDVELAGSGTAGTAPAWGPLLRACAFAETVTASTRVDYTPITTAIESVTIYYYDDGVLHKMLGCRGTVDFKMSVGERPVMSFKFTGIDGGIAATANPSTTLTAWKTPQVVTDTNSGDVTLGGTYATGAISGGTPYTSGGLEFSVGNDVKFTPLLGGETVDLTQREVTGKFMLDLTAANEVAFMATVKANTLQSVGMQHGTVAGNICLAFMPTVQLINPRKEDKDGRRLIGYDFRAVPSSGNDELRIVTK